MQEIANIFGVFYDLLLFVLAVFALHRLFLTIAMIRNRKLQTPNFDLQNLERVPRVTIQLPIYNEYMVVSRLLHAVAKIEYPKDRLEIQVLDDSTDETSKIISSELKKLKFTKVNFIHLQRGHRKGFKAGALAFGLQQAKGELVAVFDADFLPSPDFLKKVIPAFQDSKVGMVQTCWSHLNEEDALSTRAQALMLDSHFLVEHRARQALDLFLNFNGTAGVWRRKAIESSGGWSNDTLTEDLDLSFRAQLKGWKFFYLPEVKVPAELPRHISALKTQQHRWAKGSAQTARKVLGKVFRSSIPLKAKLEALFHLSSNLVYVCLTFLVICFPLENLFSSIEPLFFGRMGGTGKLLLLLMPFFFFMWISQRERNRSWISTIVRVPLVVSLGVGLSINNGLAFLEGWFRSGGEFVRTPKEGKRRNQFILKNYFSEVQRASWLEALMAFYLGAMVFFHIREGVWASLPFLLLFFFGYAYVALSSRMEGSLKKVLP